MPAPFALQELQGELQKGGLQEQKERLPGACANCIKQNQKSGQIEQVSFYETRNQAFSTRNQKIFVKMWHSKSVGNSIYLHQKFGVVRLYYLGGFDNGKFIIKEHL